MIARAAACLLLLATAGCGLMGGSDTETDLAPVCMREDPGKRRLEGSAIRQPRNVPVFDALRIEGKATRSGNLSRIWIGDYTFKARPDGAGGYTGRRGATATPVGPVSDATQALAALGLTYTRSGQAFDGLATLGFPTPSVQVATTGEARYAGPVRLTVQDLAAGTAPVEIEARIVLETRFGSQDASATITGADASGRFSEIAWSGLGLCNTRLASAGRGGFQFRNPDGRAVNFAGASAVSPWGTAILDATLYGYDSGSGRPAAIGGIVLIQGDTGLVSGIFSAPLAPAAD